MGRSPAVAPTTQAPPREQRIKAQAYALGFDLCGIARLGVPRSREHFERWLSLGRAGQMEYMSHHREQRGDARLVHPGAVSAIVVAMNYGGGEPAGPIARYARGDDYHDVIRERLRELLAWLEAEVRRPLDARPYVDTAPILERDLAREAGLGWIGKNTNLINPRLGSCFFIGSLFVDLELAPDAPFEADRCGSCRRCIDACPTDAIVAPHELDARRCVSYLTIELRDEIPEELRTPMGGLIYGCDICQEVCPYNQKFARELSEQAFAPRAKITGRDSRSLARALLDMSRAEFSAAFKGSPMKRAKLRGLKRNAAVVLGNVGTAEDVAALVAALDDDEPLVRGHAAWALGRIGAADALAALRIRRAVESDAEVLVELCSAVARLGD